MSKKMVSKNFFITLEQNEWLYKQRTRNRSESDVIRDLIETAMSGKLKKKKSKKRAPEKIETDEELEDLEVPEDNADERKKARLKAAASMGVSADQYHAKR